ncbi:MAG: 50S ribosomal protein L35ae [Candidatus Hydrothermarchaeales archaeon]
MEARITGFKRGRGISYAHHPIIECTDGKPHELIGKKIFWKTRTGKTITGKVLKPHGKTGLLTKFDKGLPGDAVGDAVVLKRPTPPKIKKKPQKTKPATKAVKSKKSEKKKTQSKKDVKKKGKSTPAKKKKAKTAKKTKGK